MSWTRPTPRTVVPSLAGLPAGWLNDGMWFLPSRGRPEACERAIKACVTAGQTTPAMLVMDGADYEGAPWYEPWDAMLLPEQHEMAGALNAAWRKHRGKSWYGFITDGVLPQTFCWDAQMIAAAGERNFASCADGYRNGARMGGIVVVPGWILEALGYWYPPGFVHLFVDDCWEALAGELDNWAYVPSVTCEYRHWSSGNAPRDDSAVRMYQGRHYHAADQARFDEWRLREMPAAVERIKAAWRARIGEPWGPRQAPAGAHELEVA